MITAALFIVADARTDIADFLQALIRVYIIIILVYIVLNLLFAFGVRPPYSRALDAVLGFLRDVSEPYLSIFRRFIPPLGPIDISPIVAILVLQIVGLRILVPAIRG
jgi:YggT family protein